jgi:hypothetical protein
MLPRDVCWRRSSSAIAGDGDGWRARAAGSAGGAVEIEAREERDMARSGARMPGREGGRRGAEPVTWVPPPHSRRGAGGDSCGPTPRLALPFSFVVKLGCQPSAVPFSRSAEARPLEDRRIIHRTGGCLAGSPSH